MFCRPLKKREIALRNIICDQKIKDTMISQQCGGNDISTDKTWELKTEIIYPIMDNNKSSQVEKAMW